MIYKCIICGNNAFQASKKQNKKLKKVYGWFVCNDHILCLRDAKYKSKCVYCDKNIFAALKVDLGSLYEVIIA